MHAGCLWLGMFEVLPLQGPEVPGPAEKPGPPVSRPHDAECPQQPQL